MKIFIKNIAIFLAGAMLAFPFYQAFATPPIKDVYEDVNVYDNELWYAGSVLLMKQLGLMQGYEDKTFRPNNPVNRAELAAILYSYYYTQTEQTNLKLEKVIKAICMDETEPGSKKELLMDEICPDPAFIVD